jgi:hypothetical protein
MNDETLCAVRNLVQFIEVREHGEPICEDAKVVRDWLGPDSDLPTKECPKCHKMTLEIHGEGILSNGRHYPMEDCNDCSYTPELMQNGTKTWLIKNLESWDTTFEEETEIPELIAKIKQDRELTPDDYEEIIFHLWQIFYDGVPQ